MLHLRPGCIERANHSSLKFQLHYPVLMDAPHLDALSSIRATHLCHDRVCRRRVRILLWVSALAIILCCSLLPEQEQSRNLVGQPETVHILMFFAKAEKNDQLQQQLRANIRSMVKYATGRIKYHFLGDANSTRIAADILENVFDTIPHREDLSIHVLETRKIPALDKIVYAFLIASCIPNLCDVRGYRLTYVKTTIWHTFIRTGNSNC
ncbi:PREDICTED: uncharacterized protein LOC106813469 [Priapulus caudatus]|uniref:Uncharacterized protein LOC106813469 n=1 Tax=Priapulus caudatus TaxID=37621 RepID=A0ABM1ELM1_PRICU|nr:PREDICTED: uncharacterized protein LOC106813469 [Priapulus caudatus]